jgi:hypothetical protein
MFSNAGQGRTCVRATCSVSDAPGGQDRRTRISAKTAREPSAIATGRTMTTHRPQAGRATGSRRAGSGATIPRNSSSARIPLNRPGPFPPEAAPTEFRLKLYFGGCPPGLGAGVPLSARSPHRLAAEDFALSRRRHGFESRWGHTTEDSRVWRSLAVLTALSRR